MYEELIRIAEREFGDVVTNCQLSHRRAAIPLKLRLEVRDGTYIYVWVNPSSERYSFHWEQRAVRGMIHRHDNAPDHMEISTFPKHFHNGSEDNVLPSTIPDEPQEALRDFLAFVRQKLSEIENE
ncbi:MAG: DUF6516 family protein [Anaerolineales bacterium]|nr:DUF6516 family protein [Anaerolineales bacterium]